MVIMADDNVAICGITRTPTARVVVHVCVWFGTVQ